MIMDLVIFTFGCIFAKNKIMYIDAILKLRSYVPTSIEKGMLFKSMVPNAFIEDGEDVTIVWEIDDITGDKEECFAKYGYPVHPYLEDEEGEEIANYESLGWIDVGRTDPLIPITTEDMYLILSMEGQCQVDCDKTVYQNGEGLVPVYYDGKVVIRY
jgi:hypothetical protein